MPHPMNTHRRVPASTVGSVFDVHNDVPTATFPAVPAKPANGRSARRRMEQSAEHTTMFDEFEARWWPGEIA